MADETHADAGSALQISDVDRFTFTLFVALALHAVLVLGLTFAPESPPRQAEVLEITLSQFDDQKDPEEADFLAATSQIGSGTEEERQELTSPVIAEQQAAVVQEAQPEPQSMPEPVPEQARAVVVSTRSPLQQRQETSPDEPVVREETPVRDNRSLMERSLEIASLEARFDEQQRAYAKRPRVLQVTAVSSLRSSHAWYVQNWVTKVTQVGNLHYPQEARRGGIYGNLRMLVALRSDGSIREITVLESSGNSVLDDAAIRIVRMAAPFAPFPPEMAAQTDQLEIIRTWSFQRRGLTSG